MRPRGFHSKCDKLLTLICGCLSLSFSLFLAVLSEYIQVYILKRKRQKRNRKRKERLDICTRGRMWPCREGKRDMRQQKQLCPGVLSLSLHIYTLFFGSFAAIYENQEPQGVHRSLLFYNSLFDSRQRDPSCNEQKKKNTTTTT